MNIQPNNQTVEKSLKGRTYYIDFYQREYVWTKQTVSILLDDIFFLFEIGYNENKGKDITPEVITKYNWYYLNIYITNSIKGKEFIVDGQQRLTTLCLIATKLYHLACANKDRFENIIDTLKDCIFGKDKYKGNIFWIDNEKRKRVMEHLINTPNKEFEQEILYTTEGKILRRYKDIDKYINDKNLDDDKLETFIVYFLERLVLVELRIEKDDTPMVFEVINDRGMPLNPFEILKGKLIGALDKDDTEKYSKIWENALNQIKGIEDSFFIDYLKGKFIYRKNAEIEKAINNEYHRYIFSENEIAKELGFRKKDENQIKNIKRFIDNDLVYYTRLYAQIKQNKFTFLSYNNDINDLSGQYQNIIAACKLNDSDEQLKIESISKNIDRLYMLLRLNGIYSSNDFTTLQYNLNELLKEENISNYRTIFNNLLIDEIKRTRNLTSVNSVLEFDKFSSRGYDNMEKRALRYFYARVEEYICSNIEKDMDNDVYYISTKTGHKTGYHIEHILSRNQENIDCFQSEDDFEIKRNKLGGLLLLYNLDNIISNNEKYYDGKRKTYNNSLIWNKTLVDSFYHKSNAKFRCFNEDFKDKTGLEFRPIDEFNSEALEYREKLLFEIVKIVWEV